MGTKFSKKLHLRVPSKRVAMASRKVFCGARRPFITGIFTLMWDSQLLAEGHTIPVTQRVAFRGSLEQQDGTVGTVVQECAPTGARLHKIQTTVWQGWRGSSQHLRRQVQVQESSVVQILEKGSETLQSTGSHQAQVKVTKTGCSS